MWPEGAKPEQQSLSGDHLVSSRRVLRGSEARGGYFFIPRGGQGVQGVRGGWNKNFLAHNTDRKTEENIKDKPITGTSETQIRD